jgi:uncharacterized protein YggU (UPF0235/DUF167 family)
MTGNVEPWRPDTRGLFLRVRVTPKASRDAIEGVDPTMDGPAVAARVRAVPEDGAANAAVERLVAEWLDVPRSSVTLVTGGKSRIKTLRVEGDGVRLARAAAQLLEAIETRKGRSHG